MIAVQDHAIVNCVIQVVRLLVIIVHARLGAVVAHVEVPVFRDVKYNADITVQRLVPADVKEHAD
jgi:hypothetical protein